MYELADNGILEEIECGSNFAYVLNDNKRFVNTDYKVLQSQTNDVFVKCMKMLYNGRVELFYLSSDFRPLESMLAGISSDVLMTIITNLLSSVLEVQNNGFLNCRNIDLSWNKIYVNPNTLKVRLVYIPVTHKVFGTNAEFENELRTSLIKLINRVVIAPDDRTQNYLHDLSNGALTLVDLCKKSGNDNVYRDNNNYSQQMGDAASWQAASTVEPMKPDVSGGKSSGGPVHLKNQGEYLKLVALNAPNYFEIVLNKPSMLLGKKQGVVDAVISFNNMISRKHCSVISNNGQYAIKDENSANGTYVNNQRLAPGQLRPLKRGDIVRMADSDFKVV